MTGSCNKGSNQMSTRHDEQLYAKFAASLQASVREQFPLVKVFIKPSATNHD